MGTSFGGDRLRLLDEELIDDEVLDELEVKKFEFDIVKAEQKLKQKDELLEKVYDEMERDLTLLGATAVEDRL